MAAKKRKARKSTKAKRAPAKRSRKRSRKRSTRRVSRAAPVPMMAQAPPSCGDNEKWMGLGLFFVGALILLNSWRAWVSWSVLVGAVLAVYGLYHYFRYG